MERRAPALLVACHEFPDLQRLAVDRELEPIVLRLPGFRLLPQCVGDFGVRLMTATRELLRTHAGAVMVNADSPTLPASILSAAVSATRRGNAVVFSPALDGGYTLIGVSKTHPRLYEDIPWSTAEVFQKTVERAAEIGSPSRADATLPW